MLALLAVVVIGLSGAILIVGSLLPLGTALLTKSSAPAQLKAVVSIALTVIATILTVAIQNGQDAIITKDTVVKAALMFVTQLAAYLGVYRPVVDVNSKIAPSKGLG